MNPEKVSAEDIKENLRRWINVPIIPVDRPDVIDLDMVDGVNRVREGGGDSRVLVQLGGLTKEEGSL